MILRDLRNVPAHFSAKTPDPRDRSQGSGAGLVGNYMKMNGVVFMEQNLGSVSVILSMSAVGEFMMWHL